MKPIGCARKAAGFALDFCNSHDAHEGILKSCHSRPAEFWPRVLQLVADIGSKQGDIPELLIVRSPVAFVARFLPARFVRQRRASSAR